MRSVTAYDVSIEWNSHWHSREKTVLSLISLFPFLLYLPVVSWAVVAIYWSTIFNWDLQVVIMYTYIFHLRNSYVFYLCILPSVNAICSSVRRLWWW